MSTSVPQPPLLPKTPAVGDQMNYKGQIYTITAVTGPTDNGSGESTYAITVNGVVVTVSAKNCVLSSQSGAYGNTAEPYTWFQSAQA